MVELIKKGVFYRNGRFESEGDPETGRKGTIAYSVLSSHNVSSSEKDLRIKFDALASHDITYVGILMTARAGGLEKLPVPYVLTNCHNSLCAVGGTINEDDHMFGLSAAKKYGAIYVPAHMAVIHAFMREMMSGCGKMILGSDSHTRYGALGTMAVGEGGPELVKQILGRTYDVAYPEVIAVHLTGKPRPGVGPQDVALALIQATFSSKFVKNKVLEFVGDGIANLPIEFRNGIDVMTTETTCLSSIWETDGETERYFRIHSRPEAYKKLSPAEGAYYDGAVEIDLSTIEPMIALPFHPSNAVSVRELNANAADILREVEKRGAAQLGLEDGVLHLCDKIDKATGRVRVDQGVIAGCAGGTYVFDKSIYEKRVWFGYNKADPSQSLSFGPNIKDWPRMKALHDNLVLGVASVIDDDVTTTDELIPSGESSSYRSNPYRLSRLTLSRRDPAYVGRADVIAALAHKLCGEEYDAAVDISTAERTMTAAVEAYEAKYGKLEGSLGVGSLVCAVRPGDGSAREQAASCQRVLGGSANIARDYATKRYRSNLINWGMLPLTCGEMNIGKNAGTADDEIRCGQWVILPGIRAAVAGGAESVEGYLCTAEGEVFRHRFDLGSLTEDERRIILAGSLTGRALEEKEGK